MNDNLSKIIMKQPFSLKQNQMKASQLAYIADTTFVQLEFKKYVQI